MRDMHDALVIILDQLKRGELNVAQARQRIEHHAAQPLGFAVVDHHRPHRCGSAEVIYAAGKTPEQVVAIAKSIRLRHPVALMTRMTADHVQALTQAFNAKDLTIGVRKGTALVGAPPAPQRGAMKVAIVTAGTSDESVAEEAALTCAAMGQPWHRVSDVGVAGLHRLGGRLAELRESSVIICIAGMEGALPSVIGGLVAVPVIAVPTSVGYGAALGGWAALLGMLNSCSAGVTVVNIDNGFGAAMAACAINRLASGPTRRRRFASPRQRRAARQSRNRHG